MKNIFRKVFLCFVILIPLYLFAAPLVKIDTTDVYVGSIREGTQESIKHPFILKNIGDEALVIEKVKSSCGCIVLAYDSVILPNREGKVTLEIKLKGLPHGLLRKYITVISNAKNKPQLRLSLSCTLITELEITPKTISLRCDKYGFTNQTLNITSTKSDLKILEVSFKEEFEPENNNTPINWQKILPLPFEFSLIKTDSITKEGYFKYKLTISQKVDYEKPVSGFFVIKTNHTQKKEILIYGVILEKGSAPTTP
ncbi:MAG: DUF1573 domain-containing protein [Chitinispirillaceae bacterium]|nr:DUF1573 domain-containing protein [Chitinispirillaceae bacterium]